MSRYAETTRAEIECTLMRYGADQFLDTTAVIDFRAEGKVSEYARPAFLS